LLLFLEMEQQLQPEPPNYEQPQPPNYEDMNIENIVQMLQVIVNMIQTIVQHQNTYCSYKECVQRIRCCTIYRHASL